jgi:tetratricopeptide (TPR) repeat protein
MTQGADLETSPGGGARFRRRDLVIFGCIVAGALVLRLVYILQYRSSPTFAHPVMDALYHVEWARALARGESFMGGEPYFRAPLYPWLLSICFRLFGEGLLVPRLFQAVLSAFACGFIFLIGRRVFGRLVGAAAGAVAAAYWLYLYFAGELLITTLIIFLDLVLIYLLLAADGKRSAGRFFAAGLILGLSAIARPNILLFGVFALAWIVLSDAGRKRRAVRNGILFGLACLIPIVPITIRNYVIGHDLVLISSQGGVNFYIGNNAASDGIRAVVPGTRPDWWGGYYDSIEMAEEAEGRNLKPSEVSEYFFRRGLRFIAEDPGAWLRLTGRKIRYYTNAKETSNNQPIRFFAERYGPIVRYLPVGFGFVAPFGIVGLILCFSEARRLFPLWGFVVIYSASVVAFFVCTRFRIPVTGIVIILACEAVRYVVVSIRRARWRRTGIAVLALALLFPAVNVRPRELKDPAAEGYDSVGIIKLEEGDTDGAVAILSEGIRKYPDNAALLVTLGEALIRAGELPEADRVLRNAIELKSNKAYESFGRAGYWLGYLAALRGDDDEAIMFFRQSIRHDPHFGKSYYYLGILMAKQNDLDEAVMLFRQALDLAPESGDTAFAADVHFDLGRALIQQGREAEGMREVGEALRLKPGHGRARAFLEGRP